MRLSTPQRILLADDDTSLRLGVADLLSGLGLEVLQAETGPEAVEIGTGAAIHAALLDLHMPGCSGLEVIPQLRATHLELPCLVYSGDLTEALVRAAEQAGAMAVLAKPVDPRLLRSEVLRALGHGSQGQSPQV